MGKTSASKVSRGPGRPRSEEIRQRILEAAYELMEDVGFNDLTIEAIAVKAGVGKPTIYRRWSSKARLVMDAFFAATNSELIFPDTGSAKEDIRQQMKQLVVVMTSSRGQMIAMLIGGGQTDPELIEAFRENWLMPRRNHGGQVFKQGIERGELRADVDLDVMIDALYSPLFYRLLLKHAPLTEAFVDSLVDVVMQGLAI
ncbi:family transcriptional regulator [Leptolyngbya sp. Heron Island J]|uniref:TetR/AcrR family transcriptional regulator n=1 Tax=Leptolyngbya sp. Heron Island J TaxID=1385935 RepID=UPI0003B99D69|nr:TetR/AcrR family transcriptional regulator [Leptolyngbya sp. Heron Island J]ESA34894.1 family transcriptional regulator [Leptolyngbya sp. Heron Island J]